MIAAAVLPIAFFGLVGLLGIAASSSAQVEVERNIDRNAESRELASEETVSVYRSNRDGREMLLEVRNGRVARIEIDGESQPVDRARRTPDGWEILGGNGEVIERLPAQEARGPRGQQMQGEARARVRAWAEGGPRPRDVVIERRMGPGGSPRVVEGMPLPKVMMGAGLGPVDEALAKHLAIDAGKATMLTAVMDGLPAKDAGLERFDVVVSVNGGPDASPDALRRALRDLEPGAKVRLGIRRGAESKEVEVAMVPFDPARLGELEPREPGGDGPMGFEIEPGGEDGMMFFFGPDGQRREFRMPPMPAMPAMPEGPGGFGGPSAEQFERMMGEFERRMDEWSRRVEERGGRLLPEGRPRDERGGVEVPRGGLEVPRGGVEVPRGGVEVPRGGRVREQGNDSAGDERIRRLEEQVERLMRELERSNARERRGQDQGPGGSDA